MTRSPVSKQALDGRAQIFHRVGFEDHLVNPGTRRLLPQFFGANPAIVPRDVRGAPRAGFRLTSRAPALPIRPRDP